MMHLIGDLLQLELTQLFSFCVMCKIMVWLTIEGILYLIQYDNYYLLLVAINMA